MAGALRNIGKNRVYRPQEETEPIKRGALATIGSERIQEKNRGGLIGGLGYVGGNLGLGIAGIGEGVGDLISAGGDLLRGDTEMAEYRFLDNQTAEAQQSLREWYNPGTVMEFAGDVASGIGQSSVFLLDAVAPGVGTGLFFAGVGGQGISSAAARTGDVGWREFGYGVASGAAEGALELALGAGSKVAGKLGASITRKAGTAIGQRGITTALTKSAGKRAWSSIAKATAKDAAGEFGEEFASEYIDTALLHAFGIDPNASTSFGEAVRAGMVGLFSGGIMGAPANVINYKNAAKAGRTIRESGETENLLNRAQATVSVLREQEAVKKAEGKKVKKTDEATEAAEQKGFLERQGAKREARRAAEYAAKLEKNVNAYRNMKEEMRNSEVGDALLGELRGNLYFTNMAYAVEEAEIVLRNVDDAQAQKIVDYINTEAKKAKQEKSDYTVEDFRLNRDGILSQFAAKGRMEQLINGEWTEAEEMAAQAAEVTESPVEAAGAAEAVAGEEVGATEQAAPAEESEAVQEKAETAAEAPVDHKARAEKLLREMGETVALDKLATAIAKKQTGEALDANERLLLKDNRKAELVLERLQRENQQKKATDKAEAKPEAKKQTKGTVTVSDGMKPSKDFSDVQYATYKAAGILSDSLGLSIEIHKSLERNDKTVNGYYDTGTKVLHVNINAMRDGRQIALYTLGHELTHYIKDWSPEKFNALADFVAEQMGTDMDSAVDEKLASLRRLGLLEGKTMEQAAEMAREEVVADGMELILTDGRVLDELAKTDKSLWEKVRDWIKSTVAKIRKYYGELNQASKTAQVLKETMDSLDELERLFTEGVREAGGVAVSEGERRYSIDEDSDTAYLAAVERGDMVTAQKMVDEAAKAAGYKIKAYHGTNAEFTTFEYGHIGESSGVGILGDGFYFTDEKELSKQYGKRTLDCYIRIRNPYMATTGDLYNLDTITLENEGYDGVILKVPKGTIYMTFESEQIKSADPVTYDDNGNVIPLSERFKEDNSDTRYSIDETAENADVSENEKLEAENKRLNEKIQRMTFERFRRAVKDGEIAAKDQKPALSKGADAVLEFIGVTDGRNKEGLLQRMSETYARMAAEKGISYEKAFAESGEIADWLISKQPLVRDAATAEQAGEIIKTLHGTKIRLTFTQKTEVTTIMGSSDAYRKAMFGKVTVNDKDGVPLDVQWAEWAEQYPEVFSKDIPEADMPERLREIYGTLVEMRDNVETIDEYISKEALTVTIFTQIGEIGYKAEEAPINDRALLAEALSGAAVSEHEYKIIKDYKAASDELAANDRRLAELRRETAELNREIKVLQDKLRGVDKTKREPWVMTALTDAIKRKGELMDEMDALAAKIKKADERFFSLRAAAPVRRAMNELNKKIKAEERRAERAEAKAEQAKEKYEAEAEYQSNRREMSVRERVARRVIGRLNTMFYSPSRTKHVPADLQALVEQVLKSEKLDTFKETRKNLRQMAELERDIEKLEQNPARTASEQERLDKLHYKYAMLEDEGLDAKGQAEALYTAFKTWMESRPEEQQDKALLDKLSSEIDKMQEMPLSMMSKKSLEAVEDFYKMIFHQVNTANQIYTTERVLYVDDLGGKASQEAQDTKSLKFLSPKAMEIKGKDSIRRFFWKNMKPLTVFEAIGSKTFTGLFQAVLDGEGVWAKDILEARAKIVEAREAHKYKDWDLEKRVEVKTKEGTVKLSLSERMSLYAYAKRAQAVSHLEGGGFVLDPKATTKEGKTIAGIALEKRLNDSTRYVLDETLMGDIASTLTVEQKAYVDEMQTYLTQLGKKGNEVSRKLYGMEIFKEDFYFPIKVESEYLASQTGKTGDPNIKNRGMTKEVVPEAKDPLVLQGFDEVMADHINSMATYHAFVLPVEDLTRVLNYKPANYLRDEKGEVILDDAGKPKADPDAAKDYSTLKAVIEDKYGADAVKYIEQVIRDLNGGARRDAAAGILDRGLTAFKRASTMASLSVLVQQPTSLIRAAAYIEPKYLFGNATIIDFKNHKELWERVKKYAPVAVIKEMGGYDTGVGTRTADYLNATEYEKGERLKGFVKDENYRAEVFGRGAAYADEMAWIQMFEACVSEQADKLGKSRDSEEVLQAAGERFEEVIRHTQVYDSTLTRSENMRSKDTGMKMATAFMAEPTTIVSMVAEAIMKAERGDKIFLRNTAAAVAGSIVINAIAASLVYALRDDDEDETYGEKYVSTLAMEVADGFNPLGYLPVARDVVSLMQGYEVERTDMALIGNLIEQVNMITSSKRSVGDKIFGVSGAVSAFFGVPVTNLYRDAKGAINTVLNSTSPEATTGAGVTAAVKKEFTTIFGLFDKQTTDGYQLYKAYVDGDTAHYNRVAARYEDEKAAEQALRKELRENDRRIGEAAKARMNGETELYESIVRAIVSERVFDRNMVIRAVNNEISALERELEKGTLVPEDPEADETPESLYKASDLNAALERGDREDFELIYDTILGEKIEQGRTEAQAKAAVKSSITAYWKKQYLSGYQETETRKRIIKLLTDTGLYGSRNDVATMCEGWVKAKK